MVIFSQNAFANDILEFARKDVYFLFDFAAKKVVDGVLYSNPITGLNSVKKGVVVSSDFASSELSEVLENLISAKDMACFSGRNIVIAGGSTLDFLKMKSLPSNGPYVVKKVI